MRNLQELVLALERLKEERPYVCAGFAMSGFFASIIAVFIVQALS